MVVISVLIQSTQNCIDSNTQKQGRIEVTVDSMTLKCSFYFLLHHRNWQSLSPHILFPVTLEVYFKTISLFIGCTGSSLFIKGFSFQWLLW